MNVVYASSDLYSELAGISIVSLFENNRNEEKITVYIIDDGISKANKEKLLSVAKKYVRTILFLPGRDIESAAGTKINVNGHSTIKSISTYYRLLLPTIMPKSVDRLIYIDCDTIVNDSLHELYEWDLGTAYAVGTDDCRGKLYRKEIGIPYENIYINCGVLLINLKAWRENDVEQDFMDFIYKHAGVVTYDDEGVLNGVLGKRGKTDILPLRYNAHVVFFYLSYKEIEQYRHAVWVYTEDEVREAVEHPVIIHFDYFFMSGTRVWNVGNKHPMKEKFYHYKSISPWKDVPDWPDDRPLKKKLGMKIFNVIPKQILLPVFSVLHANLYPRYRIALSKRAQRKVKLI